MAARPKLDPTKLKDFEIAEASEPYMKTVYQQAEELGLEKEELLPHGHYVAKVDFAKVLKRSNTGILAPHFQIQCYIYLTTCQQPTNESYLMGKLASH